MSLLLGVLSRAAVVLALHPNSVSSSRIQVDAAEVRVLLRCQSATLLESIPLDRDGDSRLSSEELEVGRADVERYVLDGYRLSTRAGSGPPTRLLGRLKGARLVAESSSAAPPAEALVDLDFHFDPIPASDSLEIDFSLFRETNPWHRDHAEILWFGKPPQSRLLWSEDPTWLFRPGDTGGGTLSQYLVMGCEHILSGYDHLAFLVALVVAARRFRSLLGVVTAFTLAHSMTLALAALGIVRLPPRPVEASIALSIAWVGFRGATLVPPKRLWPEAFVFGLVHGLGFARILADSLAANTQKLTGLVGFNLGIECGQLAIVASVALILKSIRGLVDPEPDDAETLAPQRIRRPIALLVGALGLYWLCLRVVSG
jgi:hydrogenase/urease accessory protein HupE